MEYIKLFEEFLLEFKLHRHYKDRWNLRVQQFQILDTGVKVDRTELFERIQFLLDIKNTELREKPGTSQKIVQIIDFGDMQIKKDNKIYLPTFSVLSDNPETSKRKIKTYTGSVFCGIGYFHEIVTLVLLDRSLTVQDKIAYTEKHLKDKGTFQLFEKVEHVYLSSKVNVIDMDLSREEYENSMKRESQSTKTMTPMEKETTIKKKTQLGKKTVDYVIKYPEKAFIKFTDGTGKFVEKGSKWTMNDGFTGEVVSIGVNNRESEKDKQNIMLKVKGFV